MRLLEKQLFLYSLKTYCKTGKYKILGPTQGTKLKAEALKKIRRYREDYLRNHEDYLLAKDQANLEEQHHFDLRSYHVVAVDKDRNIMGYLRLLPYPHEITFLASHLETPQNYLELNRFLVSKENEEIGKKIMFRAAVFVCVNKVYEGLTAFCCEKKEKEFMHFGLNVIQENINLKHRDNRLYKYISADHNDLLKASFNYLKKNS